MKKSMRLFVKRICAALRDRRIALGYSQDYVRTSTKIDPSRIENGKTQPGISKFVYLCKKGLNMSPGWLLILYDMREAELLSEIEFTEIIHNWDVFKKRFSF